MLGVKRAPRRVAGAATSPQMISGMTRRVRETLVREPSMSDWQMIVRYLYHGNVASVERTLMGAEYGMARDWADGYLSAFGGAYLDAAHAELERVGSRTRLELFEKAKKKQPERSVNRFPPVPHSDEFIRDKAARLVVRVSEDQRQAIRDTLMQRYNNEKRPETVVRDLRRSIGLDPRRARALRNFEDKARTEKGRNVDGRVERYREQLLRDRAETIARTESVAIENQARIEAWDIAANAGDIPSDSEQEWVTAGEPCEYCQEMDGQRVSIGGMFMSSRYGLIAAPPLHPRCYCMVILRSFKI